MSNDIRTIKQRSQYEIKSSPKTKQIFCRGKAKLHDKCSDDRMTYNKSRLPNCPLMLQKRNVDRFLEASRL